MSSYKAKPHVDPLERQARETQKRALREEDRRIRFLHNPKDRLYGVDTQFLSTQVAAKRSVAEQEKQRNAYYDDLTVYHANQVKAMERDRQVAVRARHEALENDRRGQIVDRDRALAEKANAFSLGDLPTDFLKFQGEDLDRNARVKAMQVQQQDWLAEQIQMMSEKEAFDKKEATVYDAKQQDLNELMKKDEYEMHQELRYRRIANAQENLALAEQKKRREAEARRADAALSEMELTNQLQSAYLNERLNSTNDGRAGFKGFSQDQLQAILDEQAYQREQKEVRRQSEVAQDAQYDREQEQIRRMMILADRQKAMNERAARTMVKAEQESQHLENTQRYKYLDTVMFSDPIRPEYFEQFGTSAR